MSRINNTNNDSKPITSTAELDELIKSILPTCVIPHRRSRYKFYKEELTQQFKKVLLTLIVGLTIMNYTGLSERLSIFQQVLLLVLAKSLIDLLTEPNEDREIQKTSINIIKQFEELLEKIEKANIELEEKIKRFFAVACLFYDHLPTVPSDRLRETIMDRTVRQVFEKIRLVAMIFNKQALFDSIRPRSVRFTGDSNAHQLYFPNETDRDDLVGIYNRLISQPLPQPSSSASASSSIVFQVTHG